MDREQAFQANVAMTEYLMHRHHGVRPKLTPTRKEVRLRHLVTLQHGHKVPVVLISGIGGLGFLYKRMSEHLVGHPVHVFNAIGIEADDKPVQTVQEVARIYLQQLLQVIPEGPVVLGGYSFGALVALELAIQLEASGRSVPLLVSFDGFAPGYPLTLPLSERLLVQAKAAQANLASKSASEGLTYLTSKVKSLFGPKPDDGLKFTPEGVDDPELDARLRSVATALWAARTKYRPNVRISSSVLIIKTQTVWKGMQDTPLFGWNEYINKGSLIQIDQVGGEHLQMFSQQNETAIANFILSALS